MDIKQGAQANKNGKVVERMLEPLFEDSGFKVLSYSDASKNPDLIKTLDRYVLKNVALFNKSIDATNFRKSYKENTLFSKSYTALFLNLRALL